MTIGERIKVARKKKGWTQVKLAKESGIIETTIRKYELGIQNPKVDNLQKLADALGVGLLELMSHKEQAFTGNAATDTALKGMRDMVAATELHQMVRAEKYGNLEKAYDKLNDAGKRKVVEYAEDLAKVDEYKKSGT